MNDILTENIPGSTPPLLDMDPARWRPQFYVVTLECKTDIDETAKGTITLNNQPFVLQRVTHAIIGAKIVPAVGDLEQDGQYLISWRDDSTSYQNVEALADTLFGSVRTGNFLDLPSPIVYPSSKTLTVDLINIIDRTAGAREKFKVQVVFHGVQQWSK